jgi:hypothetical protein
MLALGLFKNSALACSAGCAQTLVLGQVAFAATRLLALRTAIVIALAVPAAVAGYHVMVAVSHIGAFAGLA